MKRFGRVCRAAVLVVVILCAGIGTGLAKDKFEAEVDAEAVAVKLVRDVQRGGYGLVTTAELKQWIDSGKSMVIVESGLRRRDG